MKKIRTLLASLFLVLAFLLLFPVSAQASSPLDEIEDYTLTVNMRPDGTMDIRYHIEWKVLDDTSEGPLTWVKIGNPNEHVDEITALSDNIADISYLSDNGSFIRVDFNQEYHEGDVFEFDYTIHQSYMYIIEKDDHLCRYSFTPGWFDEIEVKNITIRWNSENVIESNADSEEDDYLIWHSSLDYGERLNASVKYNLDTFTTNENEQYTEDSGSSFNPSTAILIFVIFIIFIIIIFAIIIFTDDGYNSHSGFGGGSHSTFIYHSSCARSSCACVSCACACACAGGGRAGCSKKDFYHTNLKTDDIEKALKS